MQKSLVSRLKLLLFVIKIIKIDANDQTDDFTCSIQGNGISC